MENIKLNSYQYDKEKIEKLLKDLDCALNLTRKPVGVKILFDEEEFKEVNFKSPRVSMSYCVYVEKASRGMDFKVKLEDINCSGGTIALALEESTNYIESGQAYFSYKLYKSPAIARRAREGVDGLYKKQIRSYGLAIAPLEDFTFEPDIIIFIINPYQLMRMNQGLIYHNGRPLKQEMASMQGICSEVTARPYLSGEANSSALCPSTRFLAKWKDEEMALGLPFEKFEEMVEGVLATIEATDNKCKKEEIRDRFEKRGIKITF